MSTIPFKISITTGDSDGVGLEVTEKALLKLGPQKAAHFLIWRSAVSSPKNLRKLEKNFKLISFENADEALNFFLSGKMNSKTLVEIVSKESPATWVETTALWCFNKKIQGMVTGPISKTEIYKAGMRDMGHTDILKRISKTSNVFMGFLGKEFNVLLATAHIPLEKVPSNLSVASLTIALEAANRLRGMLAPAARKRPIAILGVNPHAGEMGLIGKEESQIHPGLLKEAKKLKIPVWGPLSPDAAFQQENWKKCSVYLAMYHDQGLIPFKLVHGQDNGVHVSVGLPFVRTSVDHGTAKDIFAKNKANPASMVDAIEACIRLIKSSIK
jgi:4-hydroxythreonine-4-phosphate dehydrogenase